MPRDWMLGQVRLPKTAAGQLTNRLTRTGSELDTPTIGSAMPRNSTLAQLLDYERLSREAKLIYVRLNTQTPIPNRDCPGIPGVAWELFTPTTRFAFGHGCD